MSRVLTALNWLPELLWVTLLWWLGCLAGAGLLGIGPATLALTSLARDRHRSGETISWEKYWQHYRASWVLANQLLLPGVALLGVASFNFFSSSATMQWIALVGVLLSVAMVAWLAPLAAHYDISIRRCWWAAFRLLMCRPLPTALHVFFTASTVLVSYFSALLAIVLAPAAWVYLVTAVAVHTFDENEARLKGEESSQFPLPRDPVNMR